MNGVVVNETHLTFRNALSVHCHSQCKRSLSYKSSNLVPRAFPFVQREKPWERGWQKQVNYTRPIGINNGAVMSSSVLEENIGCLSWIRRINFHSEEKNQTVLLYFDFLRLFFFHKSCFSVVVRTAMEVKHAFCLILIILGTLTVQGHLRIGKRNKLWRNCECSFMIHWWQLFCYISYYNWLMDAAIQQSFFVYSLWVRGRDMHSVVHAMWLWRTSMLIHMSSFPLKMLLQALNRYDLKGYV